MRVTWTCSGEPLSSTCDFPWPGGLRTEVDMDVELFSFILTLPFVEELEKLEVYWRCEDIRLLHQLFSKCGGTLTDLAIFYRENPSEQYLPQCEPAR